MVVDQADYRVAVAGGPEPPGPVVGGHQAPYGRHVAEPARPERLVARIARHWIGDLGVLGPRRPPQQPLILLADAIGAAHGRVGDGKRFDALDLHERSP